MYGFRSGTIEYNEAIKLTLLDNNLIFIKKKIIVLSHRNHLHINSANQTTHHLHKNYIPQFSMTFIHFIISSPTKLYLGNSSRNKYLAQIGLGY